MEAVFVLETFYKVRDQDILCYSHKFWFPSVLSREFKYLKKCFLDFLENLNLKKEHTILREI